VHFLVSNLNSDEGDSDFRTLRETRFEDLVFGAENRIDRVKIREGRIQLDASLGKSSAIKISVEESESIFFRLELDYELFCRDASAGPHSFLARDNHHFSFEAMEAVASECAFPVNRETTLVRSHDGCNLRLGKFLEKRHGWLAMRDPGPLCAFSIDVRFFERCRFRVFVVEFNCVWNECAFATF